MTQEERSRRYLVSTATCWGDMLGALVSIEHCHLVDAITSGTSHAPLPLKLRWSELWREHQQRHFQKRLINRDKRYKRLVHLAKQIPPPPPSTPPLPASIFLTVRDMGAMSLRRRYDVQFKIKKTTPLRKLKEAYCERLGLEDSQVVLKVAQNRWHQVQTSMDCHMADAFEPIGHDDDVAHHRWIEVQAFQLIGLDDNADKVGLEDGAFIGAFIDSGSASNGDVFLGV